MSWPPTVLPPPPLPLKMSSPGAPGPGWGRVSVFAEARNGQARSGGHTAVPPRRASVVISAGGEAACAASARSVRSSAGDPSRGFSGKLIGAYQCRGPVRSELRPSFSGISHVSAPSKQFSADTSGADCRRAAHAAWPSPIGATSNTRRAAPRGHVPESVSDTGSGKLD